MFSNEYSKKRDIGELFLRKQIGGLFWDRLCKGFIYHLAPAFFSCYTAISTSSSSFWREKNWRRTRVWGIYSNIFVTNIHLDIRSYWSFWYKYIRIFICIVFLIHIYSDICSYQNHTLAECDKYIDLWIFV